MYRYITLLHVWKKFFYAMKINFTISYVKRINFTKISNIYLPKKSYISKTMTYNIYSKLFSPKVGPTCKWSRPIIMKFQEIDYCNEIILIVVYSIFQFYQRIDSPLQLKCQLLFQSRWILQELSFIKSLETVLQRWDLSHILFFFPFFFHFLHLFYFYSFCSFLFLILLSSLFAYDSPPWKLHCHAWTSLLTSFLSFFFFFFKTYFRLFFFLFFVLLLLLLSSIFPCHSPPSKLHYHDWTSLLFPFSLLVFVFFFLTFCFLFLLYFSISFFFLSLFFSFSFPYESLPRTTLPWPKPLSSLPFSPFYLCFFLFFFTFFSYFFFLFSFHSCPSFFPSLLRSFFILPKYERNSMRF